MWLNFLILVFYESKVKDLGFHRPTCYLYELQDGNEKTKAATTKKSSDTSFSAWLYDSW